MLADQGKRPLLQAKLGAFLYPDFWALRRSAKGGEDGGVAAVADRIVAPMASGDHPAIQVQDLLQFAPVEAGNCTPGPRMRKRRNHAQATLARLALKRS